MDSRAFLIYDLIDSLAIGLKKAAEYLSKKAMQFYFFFVAIKPTAFIEIAFSIASFDIEFMSLEYKLWHSIGQKSVVIKLFDRYVKMARLSLITIYLASIFAFHCVNSEIWGDISETLETINVGARVNASSSKNLTKTVDEKKNLTKLVEDGHIYTNLIRSNPARFVLQPRQVGGVAATTTTTTTTTITYRLGTRVSGDRVIASSSSSQQWSVVQNITQNLTYPRSGIGAIITYVEIVVDQVNL